MPVTIAVPGSKSLSHRAFVFAALADRPCVVEGPLLAADTRSTLRCLRGLGARWELGPTGDVAFEPAPLRADGQTLDCGNSGTTLRLLTGLAATLPGEVVLTGDTSLRARPNGPLLRALRGLGATIDSADGHAPLTIRGPITGGEAGMPARVSSQFLSGLLLAMTRSAGTSRLAAAGPVASLPNLQLTIAVARRFGLGVQTEPSSLDDVRGDIALTTTGPAAPWLASGRFRVEADWSTAAFPLVAAAVAGVEIDLEGLDPNSRQGDRAIVEHLRSFGQDLRWLQPGPRVLRLSPAARRSPGRIDVGQTPDLFPALCALAAVTPGPTVLDGAPGLRDKECDRIAAMAAGLTALGARVRELPDGLHVDGVVSDAAGPASARPLLGASVRCLHDHRIHMAHALLAPAADGDIEVDSPDCVAISYPDFHDHLGRILAAAAGTPA